MLSASLLIILIAVLAADNVVRATVSITRYHRGDIFELSGNHLEKVNKLITRVKHV